MGLVHIPMPSLLMVSRRQLQLRVCPPMAAVAPRAVFQSRSIIVPGYGTHTIHLRVPASYSPTRPVPMVLALHGQAGSPSAANTAAQAVRNAWAAVADANGFIVIAPVATGGSGGWLAPPPNPSDYSIMAAAIADVESAYNIDMSRRIGWGFSAGGHVMHDIMLERLWRPHFDRHVCRLLGQRRYPPGSCMRWPECSPVQCACRRRFAADSRRHPCRYHRQPVALCHQRPKHLRCQWLGLEQRSLVYDVCRGPHLRD